ncbi:MAG: hypothetical protein LUF90_08275 [Rikenellaceae bacterium]|nr:hypothetical protein [Rikenellaceae bacterium]
MKRFLLFFLILFPLLAPGEVTLPKVIGDNMVLQQGKPVKIWGNAEPGERVTVNFEGKNYSTVTNAAGEWAVMLNNPDIRKEPQQMTISGNGDKIVLNNILVGEVWLASGQSNMEYSMNNHPQYRKPQKGDPDYQTKEFLNADNPLIRVLYVKKDIKSDTLPSDGWQMIDTATLSPVSAPAYFFAKKISADLGVPVGIISTSWGGTPIEQWTPMEGYVNSDFEGEIVDGKLDKQTIAQRFDKMVRPVIPYTLKGFLWYQGETNLINGDTIRYADKMKVLVDSWRGMWGDKNNTMPFYYVQIAPHTYSRRRNERDSVRHDEYGLPLFWEVQSLAQDIPNTGMIVTTDLVDALHDIHPPYKWIVGERLARLALAKDYGREGLVYSGPVYKSSTVSGNKLTLTFDHIGKELKTRNGENPDWFEISGADGIFYEADAVIAGNKIILSSDEVPNPVAARFAWHENAMPNLVNSEGLPAVPFRTKDRFEWSYNK